MRRAFEMFFRFSSPLAIWAIQTAAFPAATDPHPVTLPRLH